MSVFESTVTIGKPVNEVYTFLADMNNHRQLMPDNVVNWSSDADETKFDIENVTTLFLKIDERVPGQLVRIIPSQKPPFDMELKWELSQTGNETQVTYTITAELNMLMKMMASSPLKKLAEEETQKLAQILS
jgi:carbon monoxide dehydrogenase subunit G